MTPQKEFKLSLGLAVVLLLIGVVSYAAFPVKAPANEPLRQLFCSGGGCAAGQVLFDHAKHTKDASCSDCHHHPVEDETDIRPCGDCHQKENPVVVQQICLECHEPGEAHHPEEAAEAGDEATKCAECHMPEGDEAPEFCMECHEGEGVETEEELEPIKMNLVKRSDAFHVQCEKCHKDQNIGPKDDEQRCNWCHFRKG
jgi:hypothetical protein